MSRLISFVLADSNYLPREESENYMPTVGFELATSRLLDWRSNTLSMFEPAAVAQR